MHSHHTFQSPRTDSRIRCLTVCLVIACWSGCSGSSATRTRANPDPEQASTATHKREPYHGVLISAAQADDPSLDRWKKTGYAMVLRLSSPEAHDEELRAAREIIDQGLPLEYFIEVGRCPELAAAHPQWMASIQGHDEWRRLFVDFPEATTSQVVKVEPWVPILYRESFDAHLERIGELLSEMPLPRRLWLNDLQGAPSACGCGHPLCRWTADYGPIKTATPLDDYAAMQFVQAVQEIAPGTEVMPIFASECEAEDKDSHCGGVGCFEGKCWTTLTRQLDAVKTQVTDVGVACFYQAFDRDLPRYGDPAAWVRKAILSISEVPQLRGGRGVDPDHLVAVLQGWNVDADSLEAQMQQARAAGARGWLIALTPVDQSWQPLLYDVR